MAALVLGTAVWLMGFVNAFNFMDGVNGISGAHAVIAGVAYACFGQWRQDPFLVAMGLAVAVGALAFLPWNAVRARVFLGDVGSYALGAALAVLAVTAVVQGVPPEAALGPLALYLADTAWTLQRRVRTGERWTEAHRTHTYQRWCDVGWSHPEVTLVTAGTTILVSLLGAASLTGNLSVRLVCDLVGLAVLAGYLASPALFGHPGLPSRTVLKELPGAQVPASRLREAELQREPG
jgi:UDP-N-acetylmuramyl pentapeptide phosphotransferase/UDP-N-acetylglucosamine-1-phosphate transferase